MRQILHRQRLLFCQWPEHAFTAELKATSTVVDACSHVLTLVHKDLRGSCPRDVGARGMTAEQVLRSALVTQQSEWTYCELAVPMRRLADDACLCVARFWSVLQQVKRCMFI